MPGYPFDIRKLLKKNSVFASFSNEELDLLIPHFHEKKFQKDEWIIKEGETGTFLIFITKGKVGVYKTEPESNNTFLIREFGEIEIVGEMAMFQKGSRSASIQALEPTSVLILPADEINPDLLEKLKTCLFKYTTQRLATTNLMYVSALLKPARLYLIFLLVGIFSLIIDFFISGYLPDREAERVIDQLYTRDKNGVIVGNETIADFTGQPTLAFFIHGFMESPFIFKDVIEGLEAKNLPVDYYAPLAPFHSRNLQEMSRFNVNKLLQFFGDEIEKYAKKYKEVVLIGYSMGGAILIALDKMNLIPENCSLILYAPGIFIKRNNFSKRLELNFFRFWRNYCNYKELDCSYPVYESGDIEAQKKVDQEKNLRYRVASAVVGAYKLDLFARDHLAHINRPYALIVAEDDNRVSFENLKLACEEDAQYCEPYYFSSGRHLIHWGENKEKFIDLIAKLIVQFQEHSGTIPSSKIENSKSTGS